MYHILRFFDRDNGKGITWNGNNGARNNGTTCPVDVAKIITVSVLFLLIISSILYFFFFHRAETERGLSRKHIIEGKL